MTCEGNRLLEVLGHPSGRRYQFKWNHHKNEAR